MAEARKAIRGRVIRQKAIESQSLHALELDRGCAARILFYHLILIADDDGRFNAAVPIVRADCFPWGGRSEKQIEADLQKMQGLGLIRLYEATGERYGHLPRWYDNQPQPDPRRYYPSELPVPPDFPENLHSYLDAHGRQTAVQKTPQTAVQTAVQSASPKRRRSKAVAVQTALQHTQDNEEALKDVDVQGLKNQDGEPQGNGGVKDPSVGSQAPTSDQPIVVHHVHDTLMAKIGHKPESLPYARMGKFIVRLLKTRTPEQVNAVWDHWLASEDGWAKQHAWSWQQFEPNFDAVELALKEGRPYGQGHRGRAQANTLPAPAAEFRGGDFFAEPGVDS